MLMTGAQNVLSPSCMFVKARPSRPIWLAVLCHSERLNEHELAIGSTALLAYGILSFQCTNQIP